MLFLQQRQVPRQDTDDTMTTTRPDVRRDPFDDDDAERASREGYMDDEYCTDCGRPSHAIDNGLCPMCFETGGGGVVADERTTAMNCYSCGSLLTTVDTAGGLLCNRCAGSSAPRTPHRCPVCDGTGLVSRPPGVAGDAAGWTDTGSGPYPCRACGGAGVLWQ
jgi:hypothetical protein